VINPQRRTSDESRPNEMDENISKYKLLEEIAEGSMGRVYLAVDTVLRRKVVLKLLPSEEEFRGPAKARFIREAQAVAALNHPNVVTAYDLQEYKGRPYIVMEFVDGVPLSTVIDQRQLAVGEILDIGIQVCRALGEAHSRGIIHRDIKPANIMIDKKGIVKLLDFGIAKLREASRITPSDVIVGTLLYMAPEQLSNMEVDGRADIFGLGVVLYQMICGRLPFEGDKESVIMYRIMNEAPPPITKFRHETSEGLQEIVAKSLEKDRELRYQKVSDIMVDLLKEQQA
jgi:serine/threonine protein kinase